MKMESPVTVVVGVERVSGDGDTLGPCSLVTPWTLHCIH